MEQVPYVPELKSLIEKFKESEIYKALKLFEEKSKLQEFEEEIKNFKPKLAVIGEFSTGKSTLINSFIGRDLLPAKFKPTTQYITYLEYGEEEYIFYDGKREPLSKENLEKIKEIESDKIVVKVNSPILKEFTLIDTPGTNDPSNLSDEIVFNLIGGVDVVIFVMSINQALKETEKRFISKVIRKKDLEKFFFVLNFADMIANPREVKIDVIERLSNLLELDKEILKSHTFVYSAKNVLESRLKGEENSQYEIFIETIREFVKTQREELLREWIRLNLIAFVDQLILKIDAVLDQINNKTERYEKELEEIEKQMAEFERAISAHIIEAEKKFRKIVSNFKERIRNSIDYVYSEIESEVKEMNYEDLVGSRYIELRVKKLLEDRIREDLRVFLEEIKVLVEEFDKKVFESQEILSELRIPVLTKATKFEGIAKTGGLALAGLGALHFLPEIGLGTLGFASFGGLAGAISSIPVIGGFLAGPLTIAFSFTGLFLVTAGKILFDIGKWGISKLGEIAKATEEKLKKQTYLREIKNRLKEVEKQIEKEINKIKFEDFKEKYIESKFPQRQEILQKIELIKQKNLPVTENLKKEIALLEGFKKELLTLKIEFEKN